MPPAPGTAEESGVARPRRCQLPVRTLLANGPRRQKAWRDGVAEWLVEHESESLRQLRGSLSQQYCADPVAFERGNRMQILGSFRLSAQVWS